MPQAFFGKFTYAGTHDAAELAVKNGTVDAAADADVTYERMVAKGLIGRDTNCIIAESAPIPGPPLAFRGDLAPELKKKITEAILSAHKEIDISGYVPLSRYVAASAADYAGIKEMARSLGLTKDQMLK
jgi:phosphonate transport system substrate-binding protein